VGNVQIGGTAGTAATDCLLVKYMTDNTAGAYNIIAQYVTAVLDFYGTNGTPFGDFLCQDKPITVTAAMATACPSLNQPTDSMQDILACTQTLLVAANYHCSSIIYPVSCSADSDAALTTQALRDIHNLLDTSNNNGDCVPPPGLVSGSNVECSI
jgi:hypothetical protein